MKIKFKKILIILTLVILSITGCSSNTNDNNKAFNLLSNKEDLKESEERLGDYILNKKDNDIFITILQNDNKPIRIRDIKSYFLKNTINIKNIRKLKLV